MTVRVFVADLATSLLSLNMDDIAVVNSRGRWLVHKPSFNLYRKQETEIFMPSMDSCIFIFSCFRRFVC